MEEEQYEDYNQEADEIPPEPAQFENNGVKWQAALAYLPLICLIPLFLNRDDPFIQRHAKQGFLLFLALLLAYLLRIDAIWNLIIAVCFATALVGALGILIRGEIRIPLLSDIAEKLRI